MATPPPAWLKRLYAAPQLLYRVGLGRLAGHRFLLLTHTGRRTGARHRAVVEYVLGSGGRGRTFVGPDASGPAAFGLCTAYGKGGLNSASVAYRNLAQAAGGASNIVTYCATVKAPGQAASHLPAAPAMPTQAASGMAHAPSTPGGAATTPVMPTQASTGTTHKPTSVGRP